MAQKRSYKQPATTKVVESLAVADDLPEVSEVVEVVAETAKAYTYTAKDGDNWQTIARMFKPDEFTRNEYAQMLFNLNGRVNVRAGLLVQLV